jgi:hypothetical protein
MIHDDLRLVPSSAMIVVMLAKVAEPGQSIKNRKLAKASKRQI